MHQSFWMDVFPNRIAETLSRRDFTNYFAAPRRVRPLAPSAYIMIERLSLRGVGKRIRPMLARLLESAPDEGWNNAGDGNYGVLVWETSDIQRAPLGFLIFRVDVIDGESIRQRSSSTPIRDISFSCELSVVRPDKRGRGYGRYMSCGVLKWLDQCRLVPPRCVEQGVDVMYHAEFDSEGGARCSSVITGHFQHLQDMGKKGRAWRIADFMDNSGY